MAFRGASRAAGIRMRSDEFSFNAFVIRKGSRLWR